MPLKTTCEKCGVEFDSYPSDQRRFCGTECARSIAGRSARTHGKSNTRLHNIWCHMKTRCYCETCNAYPYYGGRGIVVCNEWRNAFTAFEAWAMANGYSDSLEIERINNDGNYEPNNGNDSLDSP